MWIHITSAYAAAYISLFCLNHLCLKHILGISMNIMPLLETV